MTSQPTRLEVRANIPKLLLADADEIFDVCIHMRDCLVYCLFVGCIRRGYGHCEPFAFVIAVDVHLRVISECAGRITIYLQRHGVSALLALFSFVFVLHADPLRDFRGRLA